MGREKVLITVKTYPTLSRKHGELVCTAGVREDGSWVRLYPIPFRLLDYKGNPVGVELVRGLHSVVETAKATSGLLVTTSYFTKGARALQDTYKHRLDLADFNRLQGMLKSYKGQLL